MPQKREVGLVISLKFCILVENGLRDNLLLQNEARVLDFYYLCFLKKER